MLLIAILPVLIWIVLLVGRGGFWRVKKLMPSPSSASSPVRSIAVVIPARNEADVIGRAIASVFAQDYSGDISIFVVDDESEDGTAEITEVGVLNSTPSRQVSVMRSRPLPDGWTGKMWAVSQGVGKALATSPDYLLLTDADVEHSERSFSELVTRAEKQGLALASVMVTLKTDTLAEKALIPAFVYFFFLLYPPAWVSNSRRKTAGAAGGCMLVRPSALIKAGGIAAIRNEVIDDCALARAIKSSGGRVWLGFARGTKSLRGYGGFRAIGTMISRTAYNQLHHSPLLLIGTLVGLLFTFLVPCILLIAGDGAARPLSAVALLLMTLSYVPTVRLHRQNLLWAVSLPVVTLFYAGATIHSAIQFHAGRGGFWKGRFQDTAGGRGR
jgi:hopene-associated glycosyltransferase HpnB